MSTAGKGEARSKPAAARVSEGGLGKRLRAWRGQHAYSLVSSLGRLSPLDVITGRPAAIPS